MHDAVIPHHFAAENMADALMAQTHTERRDRGGIAAEDVVGNASFIGRARARRNDKVRWPQLGHIVGANLVVPKDPHIERRIQFAESLHEVVSEGVVIVNEQDHAVCHPCLAGIGWALLTFASNFAWAVAASSLVR